MVKRLTAPRLPGWERAYVEIMTHHAELPFGWHSSDCLIIAADLARGMTGVDPMRGLRRYSTETGAMKLLLKAGFRTVEEALEAAFPPIDIAYARRGDCGVLEQSVYGQPWLSTLIVLGDRAMGKGPRGPVYVPTQRLKRCFAIGAV
ncbi:hypothetical protein PSC71_08415 [Devosia sp. J2-20]|uniref:DUF6950 family protein n=1 Tax=Devosia sp. J2-20 TaxID=3026161 RepID=UPI002499ED61|nr:hypothetical protein [Devosia sp. J2-20]WDR00757.1 hypothetical protein PSC71_08415 [Devosia sp. J2-20]